jgi:hypothetical protein
MIGGNEETVPKDGMDPSNVETACENADLEVAGAAATEKGHAPKSRVKPVRLLAILGLGLLALAAFSNSISGEFVRDDTFQIVENPMLGKWDAVTLKRAVTRDFWANIEPDRAGERIDSVYYRPVFLIALMTGHKIAGTNPVVWHLIAISLHLGAAILVFFAVERMLALSESGAAGDSMMLSFAAAAIFLVHPVQSESAAWISGLVGPLSTGLMLASFLCYLSFRQTRRYSMVAASLVFFVIAIFAKEQALVLPLIVLCCELFVFRSEGPARVSREGQVVFATMIGCVSFYLVCRYAAIGAVLGHSRSSNFPDDASLTLADQLRTTPGLLLQYCKLIVYPAQLSLMYAFGYVRDLSVTGFWIPLLAICSIGGVLVYGARRSRAIAAATIWMVFPLLPHLNLRAFVSDEIIHDRYLYGSMVGVVMLSAMGMRLLSKRQFVRGIVAALILTGLVVLTARQNRHWRTNETLWQRASATAPNSRLVHIALGALAEDRNDPVNALDEYEAALTAHPDVLDALNNSALLIGRAGGWVEAARRFERIVEITPDKAIAHFNLSFAYAVLRRYDDAIREQRRAIDLDPAGNRVEEWRLRLAQLEKVRGPSAGAVEAVQPQGSD